MARINWYEPRFDEDELKEVEKVIRECYVNEGPKTKELEEQVKKFLGVKYAIITANATAALFLAIKSEAIIRNVSEFEVIVPDMTMIASATSVDWAGGKAVLVDVERDKGTIDVKKIETKITPKTIAIMPVHVLGRSADMDKLMEISKKYNLALIEDAAGALGSKNLKGNYLGTIGKIGCYSLQSNKIITSGQGGIIVTNDERSYEIMRRLRDFGRMNNKEMLHEINGYNLKFSDLAAAMAIAQFRKINARIDLLISQKSRYEKNLAGVKEIKFFKYNNGEVPLWIDVFAEKRTELVSYLNKSEIYPRECWPSVHKNKPYLDQGSDSDFPNSTFISDNILWIPNGPGISNEQIDMISEKIKEFYKK